MGPRYNREMRTYVIIGAGAVGSALGGLSGSPRATRILVGAPAARGAPSRRREGRSGGVPGQRVPGFLTARSVSRRGCPRTRPVSDRPISRRGTNPDAWREFASRPLVTWQQRIAGGGSCRAYFPELWRSRSLHLHPAHPVRCGYATGSSSLAGGPTARTTSAPRSPAIRQSRGPCRRVGTRRR